MVEPGKERQALAAIQIVFIGARYQAHQRADHREIARVLDVGEYLLGLMLEPTDRTSIFRDQLVGLAERSTLFGAAVEKFDQP